MSQHGERGDDVRKLLLAVAAAYKAEANLSDDDDNEDGAQAEEADNETAGYLIKYKPTSPK